MPICALWALISFSENGLPHPTADFQRLKKVIDTAQWAPVHGVRHVMQEISDATEVLCLRSIF
jgi:hypothetical protein